MAQKEKSGLATAGMALGIIGICLSIIPIINNIAFILALLGLVFGIIGIVQTKNGRKSGKGKAIAAVILAVLTIVLVLASQKLFSDALDDTTSGSNNKSSTSESVAPEENATTEEEEWDMEAAYAKIENGMTKAQVEEATGKESESCTESEIDGLGKSELCTYGNVIIDKGAITVTFSQDKVSSKTKSTY